MRTKNAVIALASLVGIVGVILAARIPGLFVAAPAPSPSVAARANSSTVTPTSAPAPSPSPFTEPSPTPQPTASAASRQTLQLQTSQLTYPFRQGVVFAERLDALTGNLYGVKYSLVEGTEVLMPAGSGVVVKSELYREYGVHELGIRLDDGNVLTIFLGAREGTNADAYSGRTLLRGQPIGVIGSGSLAPYDSNANLFISIGAPTRGTFDISRFLTRIYVRN